MSLTTEIKMKDIIESPGWDELNNLQRKQHEWTRTV